VFGKSKRKCCENLLSGTLTLRDYLPATNDAKEGEAA
jgi:hypothetical protein